MWYIRHFASRVWRGESLSYDLCCLSEKPSQARYVITEHILWSVVQGVHPNIFQVAQDPVLLEALVNAFKKPGNILP